MSKYFTKYATGGKFKTTDSGDLGLQAIKDYQQRQIEYLKEQGYSRKEIDANYLQALKGVSRTEEWNQQIIQDFEKNTRSARQKAIENVQEQELTNLKEKGKQAERASKNWQELSPTLSKNLGKVAGAIEKQIDEKRSKEKLAQEINDPNYQDKIVNPIAGISQDLQEDAIKERAQFLLQKNPDFEKASYIGKKIKTNLSLYGATKHGEVVRNIELISNQLIKDIEETGTKITEKNVVGFYINRGLELVATFGLNSRNKGSKGIHDTLLKAGLEHQKQIREGKAYKTSQKDITQSKITYIQVAASGEDRTVAFNNYILDIAQGWKKGPNNTLIPPNRSGVLMKDHYIEGFRLLIYDGHYSDIHQLQKDLKIRLPGKKGKDSKDVTIEQNWPSIDEEVTNLFTRYRKLKSEEKSFSDKDNDKITFSRYINIDDGNIKEGDEGWIDLDQSTPKGRANLFTELQKAQNGNMPDSTQYIANKINWPTNSTTLKATQDILKNAWIKGNARSFLHTYFSLPPNERNKFGNMYKGMKRLLLATDMKGVDQFKEDAKAKLFDIRSDRPTRIDALTSYEKRAKEDLWKTALYHFTTNTALQTIEDPEDAYDKAWEITLKDFKDKTGGLFKRKEAADKEAGSSTDMEWAHDPHRSSTTEQKPINNVSFNIGLARSEPRFIDQKNTLSQSFLAHAARNINDGKALNQVLKYFPDTEQRIKKILEKWPELTAKELINRQLTANGFTQQIITLSEEEILTEQLLMLQGVNK